MYIVLFNILLQGKERPAKDKIDADKTLRSVSHRGVWLYAVLATFGFL